MKRKSNIRWIYVARMADKVQNEKLQIKIILFFHWPHAHVRAKKYWFVACARKRRARREKAQKIHIIHAALVATHTTKNHIYTHRRESETAFFGGASLVTAQCATMTFLHIQTQQSSICYTHVYIYNVGYTGISHESVPNTRWRNVCAPQAIKINRE